MKILVIEDNPKHLLDVKKFFSTVKDVQVTYQESYQPFDTRADDLKNYNGVVSDIYFPTIPGGELHPIGVSIMFQCKMMGIPCVLCTAGYHHGTRYQWINDMWAGLRDKAGWEDIPKIIDSQKGEKRIEQNAEGERVEKKGWEAAWEELQKYLR